MNLNICDELLKECAEVCAGYSDPPENKDEWEYYVEYILRQYHELEE
jgi:hypothetical protein